MGRRPRGSSTLLQGTLDLLILHVLQRGALHGYAIAQTIHLLSDQVLKVEELAVSALPP
jgi:DNA-binding PadR family transcriptional regulator